MMDFKTFKSAADSILYTSKLKISKGEAANMKVDSSNYVRLKCKYY